MRLVLYTGTRRTPFPCNRVGVSIWGWWFVRPPVSLPLLSGITIALAAAASKSAASIEFILVNFIYFTRQGMADLLEDNSCFWSSEIIHTNTAKNPIKAKREKSSSTGVFLHFCHESNHAEDLLKNYDADQRVRPICREMPWLWNSRRVKYLGCGVWDAIETFLTCFL